MKKITDFIVKHWRVGVGVFLVFVFMVATGLFVRGCQAKEKPIKEVLVLSSKTNDSRVLEVFESSLSHGRVVIICGTNVMDHPFITSHDAFAWVVGIAKKLPSDQSIRLVAKGDTLDVDKMFESLGDLIAFVASWRDTLHPSRVVSPVSTNRAARTSAADTAYVNAEIERLRKEKDKKSLTPVLIFGNPHRVVGLPPLSRSSGFVEAQSQQPVSQYVSGSAFSSLQPPAFDRPDEKRTGLGRWWQRVSGPNYTVVAYTPRRVSWEYRQAYPCPMYASVGVFQPTPVMIGRSW